MYQTSHIFTGCRGMKLLFCRWSQSFVSWLTCVTCVSLQVGTPPQQFSINVVKYNGKYQKTEILKYKDLVAVNVHRLCFFVFSNRLTLVSISKTKFSSRPSVLMHFYFSAFFYLKLERTECVNQPPLPTHTQKDKITGTERVKLQFTHIWSAYDKFKNIKNFVLQLQIHISFYRMHIFIWMCL